MSKETKAYTADEARRFSKNVAESLLIHPRVLAATLLRYADLLTENEQLRATIATLTAELDRAAKFGAQRLHEVATLTAKVEELTRAVMTDEQAEKAASEAADKIVARLYVQPEPITPYYADSVRDIILSAINEVRRA